MTTLLVLFFYPLLFLSVDLFLILQTCFISTLDCVDMKQVCRIMQTMSTAFYGEYFTKI